MRQKMNLWVLQQQRMSSPVQRRPSHWTSSLSHVSEKGVLGFPHSDEGFMYPHSTKSYYPQRTCAKSYKYDVLSALHKNTKLSSCRKEPSTSLTTTKGQVCNSTSRHCFFHTLKLRETNICTLQPFKSEADLNDFDLQLQSLPQRKNASLLQR
jgi:hypothetical protein